MVASDRVSVFDVILPNPVPGKGRVLTALSTWWFAQTEHLVPNHLVSSDPADFPAGVGPEAAGPLDAGEGHRPDPARVRGTRLPVRLRVVRLPGHRLGAGARTALRPAPGRATPRAALHAHHQGRGQPRPPAHRRRGRRADRRRPLRAGARPHADALRVRRRARAALRDRARRHQARVRRARTGSAEMAAT